MKVFDPTSNSYVDQLACASAGHVRGCYALRSPRTNEWFAFDVWRANSFALDEAPRDACEELTTLTEAYDLADRIEERVRALRDRGATVAESRKPVTVVEKFAHALAQGRSLALQEIEHALATLDSPLPDREPSSPPSVPSVGISDSVSLTPVRVILPDALRR